MQVYTLNGESEERSFTRDWGVGLAIENGTQLQKALKAAVEGAVILYILQRLSPGLWLETHLDCISVQATMLTGRATSWVERMRAHGRFCARIAE